MADPNLSHFNTSWPADRPFQVVGFGQNAVDSICVVSEFPPMGSKARIEQLHRLGGGQVATAAALCGRWGLKTRYVGRVGDDLKGVFSLEDLKKEPMDTTYVEVMADCFSQYAVILVDGKSGERTVLWDRDPQLVYEPDDLQRASVVKGQLLHLDGYDLEAAIQAAEWAKEAGMLVCIDIDHVDSGVERMLRATDFVIASQDFVRDFARDGRWQTGMREVGKITSGYVIATRGIEGAAYLWEDQIVLDPGFPIDATDTTAAGDVFHGAFIYALFENRSVADCVRFSNAAAMLACSRYGARDSIPSLDDVERVLAREGAALQGSTGGSL
jgi:sugar/nucleoside kinase (ribokinase family)